jgi:hypothetical protein
MKWHHDNGKLMWMMTGAVVLILVLFIAGCNGCLQAFWEIGNSSEERLMRDSIESSEK